MMNKGQLAELMKQAQQMQENVRKVQEQLAAIEVEGQAGAGMVKVLMTCRYDVKRVTIDPSLVGDDKEMLEDLVAAAVNDAVRRVESTVQEKMASVTAGLPLPPDDQVAVLDGGRHGRIVQQEFRVGTPGGDPDRQAAFGDWSAGHPQGDRARPGVAGDHVQGEDASSKAGADLRPGEVIQVESSSGHRREIVLKRGECPHDVRRAAGAGVPAAAPGRLVALKVVLAPLQRG